MYFYGENRGMNHTYEMIQDLEVKMPLKTGIKTK